MTSDHGRAHERREQVSDPQLTNTRTSVAAEMAVDPRTDWQTIHEPKGGEEGASQTRRMVGHGREWRKSVSREGGSRK